MNPLHDQLPVARLINVSKVYQGQNPEAGVLKRVSFEALPGTVTLLLGPSGSGKSTFLTILAGLLQPTAGEALLFGKNVQAYSRAGLQQVRATRIGFVFQTFHLIHSLNALENVLLAMRFADGRRKNAYLQAIQLLDRFGVGHLAKSCPGTMSQGEKQRVAVARALANNASLIIADEPTGSLATEQGLNIVRLLKETAETENRCVVIASHDRRIARYADNVLHLKDGEIVTKHTPS